LSPHAHHRSAYDSGCDSPGSPPTHEARATDRAGKGGGGGGRGGYSSGSGGPASKPGAGGAGTNAGSGGVHYNTGTFIEWKLVKNDSSPSLVFPSSPSSSDGGPPTPPGSVPGSPSSMPGSPQSPVPDIGADSDSPDHKAVYVPPLLRPRQVHPTKANKLGIAKPVKKRRNTEHLYCRHCGTTETPEWRRGPDGRKSLCNACGLYFSKMVKRETLVVPDHHQGRRVAIDALLNP